MVTSICGGRLNVAKSTTIIIINDNNNSNNNDNNNDNIGGIHAVAGWNPRSSHPGFNNVRKADLGRYFGVSIWPPVI